MILFSQLPRHSFYVGNFSCYEEMESFYLTYIKHKNAKVFVALSRTHHNAVLIHSDGGISGVNRIPSGLTDIQNISFSDIDMEDLGMETNINRRVGETFIYNEEGYIVESGKIGRYCNDQCDLRGSNCMKSKYIRGHCIVSNLVFKKYDGVREKPKSPGPLQPPSENIKDLSLIFADKKLIKLDEY